MKKRSFPMRLLSLLFVFALLVVTTTAVSPVPTKAASISEQIAALEKEQQEIKDKIADAKGDMADSKETRDLYDGQIQNVTQQINLLDEQIGSLNTQIGNKNATIASLQAQITANKEQEAQTREMLGQRLRAIAKRGNLSTTLQMLLNTDNYTDYLIKKYTELYGL